MMQRSDQIDQLARALARAQGKMAEIPRQRVANIEGGRANYSYDYANLADVLRVVKGPLSEASLSITQHPTLGERGLQLVTMLMHESGQWMSSVLPIKDGGTPQAMGSAITYARRYALLSVLGVATQEEDDDGAAASKQTTSSPSTMGPKEGPREVKHGAPRAAESNGTGPKPDPKRDYESDLERAPSEQAIAQLMAAAKIAIGEGEERYQQLRARGKDRIHEMRTVAAQGPVGEA